MNRYVSSAIVGLLIWIVSVYPSQYALSTLKSADDVRRLFSATADAIMHATHIVIDDAERMRTALLAIPHDQRTYENTVLALDYIMEKSQIAIMHNAMHVLEKVHPDRSVADAARKAQLILHEYSVDYITSSYDVYRALVAYAASDGVAHLSAHRLYVLNLLIRSYERSGIGLSPDGRQNVALLTKKINQLNSEFMHNIASDKHHIIVKKEELAGVDPMLIAQLQVDTDGYYYVGVDKPTYLAVMRTCTVEQTRKALQYAYNNRAYPENEAVLKELIAARDDLARVLGFASYADLNLDDSMVGSPDGALRFLYRLLKPALEREKDDLLRVLHGAYDISADRYGGTIPTLDSWNELFLLQAYQKKVIGYSEDELAHYFPMNRVIDTLLDLYHDFFNLRFVEIPLTGLWHDTVRCVEVYAGDTTTVLGYLLLDLHSRPDKFSHACHSTVIPACFDGNAIVPAVSVIIGNFPSAYGDRPALWSHAYDVTTFFHEFGHAIHALLGRTELAVVAGTNVKRDFVEMPSQMLEEWLFHPLILKRISSHYITGDPLPDELIERMHHARKLYAGSMVRGQLAYALISLAYYGPGRDKDPYLIMRDIQKETSLYMAYHPEYHPYTSFLHLASYGAQYYGYLWSKVFAVDIFQTIEERGMSYMQSGKQYIDKVLSCGGGENPQALLYDFLGREPRAEAFLKAYGFYESNPPLLLSAR